MPDLVLAVLAWTKVSVKVVDRLLWYANRLCTYGAGAAAVLCPLRATSWAGLRCGEMPATAGVEENC